MGVFEQRAGHELVVHGADDVTGLRCIIALHSTALGPGLGGTRFVDYPDSEAALVDVLRLSEGMTLKNACAGLAHGGGKAVILGDPAELRSDALLRAYGRVVDSLGGRYVTACDVGTRPQDMDVIGQVTSFVTGRTAAAGGVGDSGIPTAHGVHVALRATARRALGSADLAGVHVAVQGLGKVGRRLAQALLDDGASLTVADPSRDAVAVFADHERVEVVGVDEILFVEADILSPNALGDVLNDDTIGRLAVAAVCGGANNQLGAPHDAAALRDRGIVYAPDFVVNAGGVIAVADERHAQGHDPDRVMAAVEHVDETLVEVYASADEHDTDTETAARAVAQRRIAAAVADRAAA